MELEDNLFESAFNFSSIGMAIVSLEGAWLNVNNSLSRMLGYTEDEFQELTFQEITHPEDLSKDLHFVQELLSGKISSYEMEKRYFHRSGSIVWASLSVSLIRKNGEPQFFISQIQNITHSKEIEQKLVIYEKAMAEWNLSTRFAHDINNPLTILAMSLRVIEIEFSNEASDTAKEYFTKMQNAISRIESLVTSLNRIKRPMADGFSKLPKVG